MYSTHKSTKLDCEQSIILAQFDQFTSFHPFEFPVRQQIAAELKDEQYSELCCENHGTSFSRLRIRCSHDLSFHFTLKFIPLLDINMSRWKYKSAMEY
jgi:hypothetical protein